MRAPLQRELLDVSTFNTCQLNFKLFKIILKFLIALEVAIRLGGRAFARPLPVLNQ
jgi:hypothetical protein